MDLYIYYLHNNNIRLDCDLEHFRSELKARNEIIDNDSECENEDYVNSTFITRQQQGLYNEHHEINSSAMVDVNKDIFTQQQTLKTEAKLALVLSAKMARMQVELERQAFEKKQSSLYDLMGINANVDKPFSIDTLEEMNIGQLQAIINDLHSLTEANNDELVRLLIERDSLSMEQDSILVDIEDIQKRVQECEMNSSKQSSQYVYIVKRPARDIPKKSIFQNLLRKAMFN